MFFSYSPDLGFDTHATAQDAESAAQEKLQEYRDAAGEGWADETDQVCWGEITESARVVKREPAPTGSEFDEILEYALIP